MRGKLIVGKQVDEKQRPEHTGKTRIETIGIPESKGEAAAGQ